MCGVVRCGCVNECGDLPPQDDHEDAVCKGLPRKREPLIEIVMVPRGSDA